jgi:hypothetical protein
VFSGDITLTTVGDGMIGDVLTSWKLWLAVRRARREIERIARHHCPTAKAFSRQGATPRHLSFRIVTTTDKERDRMRAEPNLHQQFCNALVHAGYPSDAVPSVHFRIESQETVDRDYGGSWQEEGEMP